MPTPSATWRLREAALAVAPVAVMAAATIWWPQGGDQSLFILGAERLEEGLAYYRDFWDVKQPGIYWVYQATGLLDPALGSPGAGARAVEPILAVIAATMVLYLVRDWDLHRSVRLAAPSLVLVPYLWASAVNGVGQIEGLMNALLLATAAACQWGLRRDSAVPWLLAGLAVGATAVLKTLYAPLPVLMTLGWALSGGTTGGRAGRRLSLVAAGALIPVAAALAYLAVHDVLRLALVTTVGVAGQMATLTNPDPSSSASTLAVALTRTVGLTGPLALVALSGARRRGTLRRDVALATTVVAGFVLALPQLATSYRLLMLAAPTGLLAVAGLQQLLDRITRARTNGGPGRRVPAPAIAGLAGLAAVLAAPGALPAAVTLARVPAQGAALDLPSRLVRNKDPFALASRRATALVAPDVRAGEEVYVLGDPSIMLLLEARQGIEITGWSLELMPSNLISEMGRELGRSRPRLVYLDAASTDLLAALGEKGDPITSALERYYQVRVASTDGTWYETAQPGPPLPSPDGVRL